MSVKRPCNCKSAPVRLEILSLTTRLRQKSRKITGPRSSILQILRRHAHPISIREIHAELPAGQGDLATVYRAMQMLVNLGMVRRFDFGEGAARFELVEEGDTHHYHHLICTECASVVKIHKCFPAEIQDSIASENGFSGVTHRLEFFGICPGCRAA